MTCWPTHSQGDPIKIQSSLYYLVCNTWLAHVTKVSFEMSEILPFNNCTYIQSTSGCLSHCEKKSPINITVLGEIKQPEINWTWLLQIHTSSIEEQQQALQESLTYSLTVAKPRQYAETVPKIEMTALHTYTTQLHYTHTHTHTHSAFHKWSVTNGQWWTR